MHRFLPLAFLLLAACGGTELRYLIEEPSAVAAPARLAVGSIEVRQISLPAYAEDAEILREEADGALRPIGDAIWADDPSRALTQTLAQTLGQASRATVAAEPWPLTKDADVAVHVRVSDMIARADGSFDFSGQFALSSPEGAARERVEDFDITIPLTDPRPRGIAAAGTAALRALADRILAVLAR